MLTVRVGVAATAASVAVVGVGYAACQMFPLAMLPDVAAADTARTGESRAGTYTGVWTAGETLGLALGPLLYAGVLAAGGYVSSTDAAATQPASAHTAITLGFTIVPAALVAVSPAGPSQVPARPGGVPVTPPTSTPTTDDVLATLRALQALDLPAHGGRTLAYVYDSGLADADAVGREALAMFASSNGLDPTAFPSLLRMENDLVALTGGLLDAPDGHVGSVTSGGTESILLAVLAARQARPRSSDPSMVIPTSAHAAFHKAAALLRRARGARRRRPRHPARRPRRRWPRRSTTRPCSSSPRPRPTRTAWSTRSPRSLPLAGRARHPLPRRRLHRRVGAAVPRTAPRRGPSRSRASRSISVDLHKYALHAQGRLGAAPPHPGPAPATFFASANWPGYTMLNSTMQSTRSGGPLAAAWAVTQRIGVEGYARLAHEARDATLAVADAVDGIPGLRVLTAPDSTLVALVADELLRRVHRRRRDARAAGGSCSRRCRSATSRRRCTSRCRPATAPSVPELVVALRESVDAAPRRRPGRRRPGSGRCSSAGSTPRPSTTQGFAGLLAAAGLAGSDGALALPSRMAPVNALLDACPPALREALLLGVLDRLSRPTPT